MIHLGVISQVKTQGKILIFPSVSLGTCPLQVISQVKTQRKILIFPSDSLGSSHRHVTGHTKNEYKEQEGGHSSSKSVQTNRKGGEYRRGREPVSIPSKKKNSIRVSGGILPPMP